ncbi:MAG: RNA polymerase sigma-70 factor [Balneolaceae bacterium]
MEDYNSEDCDLLLQIKTGNEQSFRLIYEKFHKPLYLFALKYLRSKELAEDAVHDVFIKLWNNRKKLDTSGSLKGFLFTATKNHVLNMLRNDKEKMKKHILLQYEGDVNKQMPNNVSSLSEYWELCQLAVLQLPERRREVFELRTNDGLTNQEVAQYLDISENTVKVHYYKATNFIREFVKQSIARKTGS